MLIRRVIWDQEKTEQRIDKLFHQASGAIRQHLLKYLLLHTYERFRTLPHIFLALILTTNTIQEGTNGLSTGTSVRYK